MGGKSATSTQQVQIPPSVLAQYQSVNDRATQTASTPFQQYWGQFVAPVNQQQQKGIAGTNAAANEAQPYFGAATGTLGQAQAGVNPINQYATGLAAGSAQQVNPTALTGESINQYLSPYLQDVGQSTANLLGQNNLQQQSGALGTAIQSGAFGGDRTGIAAANLQQQQNLANANIYSGIANQGYLNAQGVAQQQQGVGLAAGQANRAAMGNAASNLSSIGQTAYGEGANTSSQLAGLGAGAQSAALQGAQAQIGAGTLQQQTQQAQDTAQYNQFLQQQSYPFQVDQFLANIAEGTGALSGSTTTTTQPGGFFSDERLKHDIQKVGKTFDGQDIVSYKMQGDDRTRMGLIAQDVEKKHPNAVGLAAGYKVVDYGKATEKAANRGHFYSGGVVPIRQGMAGGGDPYDYSLGAILAAQQGMYGQPGSRNRNIPNQGGGTHQLTVASGSPAPVPSGSSKTSQLLQLEQQGQKVYKGLSGTSTPAYSGPTTGAAASGTSDAGYDAMINSIGPTAAAPAADTGGLGAASAAGSTAAPTAGLAGAEAAGTAAAAEGAGAGAAAAGSAAASAAAPALASAVIPAATEETAAAIAAEYAASIAAAAMVAAKRGGRIRDKFAAGGMPYEGGLVGTPYQDQDGVLIIPDAENTQQLKTAGPLKKQPTGLQTAMSLGQPDTASSAIGGMFSNSALARGGLAGGRRGYDDGGDVETLPEIDVSAKRPDPIKYTGPAPGLTAAAPVAEKAMPSAEIPAEEPAPKAEGLKAATPADSGSTDHWYKHAENVVPLLTGLAAMGTAPTRSWGTALAAGLGAGAESWLPAQQQQAEVQRTQQQARGLGYQSDIGQATRDFVVPYLNGTAKSAPAVSPASSTSKPVDANTPLADRLRSQYAIQPILPQEAQTLQQAGTAAAALKNPQWMETAKIPINNRIAAQDFQNKNDARQKFDEAYSVYQTAKDPAMRDAAAATANAYQQWTGDQYESRDGVVTNTRTNQPPIGAQAQRISPTAYMERMAQATAKSAVPTGVPGETVLMPNWRIVGAKSAADYVASLPPPGTPGVAGGSAAAPRAPAINASVTPPTRPVAAPPPISSPAAAPPVAAAPVAAAPAAVQPRAEKPTESADDNAFSDPKYKLPPAKRQIGLTPGQAASNQVEATSKRRMQLQEDAEATAQSSAAALQYALAAQQIMDSKGKPVTGFFGPMAKQITSIVNGSNASNYEDLAKNLGNLAVQSSKGNFPHATEKETMVQFEQLSPNTAHTTQALRDLLEQNIRTNQYTLDTANRVGSYLDPKYDGDPQKFFRWNQEHYPRADAVNLAAGPTRISSVADYAKVPAGAQYIDPNGVTRTKGGG